MAAKKKLRAEAARLLERLDAAAEVGNVADAEALLHRASPLVSAPRQRTMLYNTVLKACARSGDVARAEHWHDTMVNEGVQVNHKSFGKLIEAAAKLGQVGPAESFFRRLCANVTETPRGAATHASAAARPNKIIVGPSKYNAVIHASAKSSDARRSACWLERMAATMQPDDIAYNSTITASARAGDAAGAGRLFRRMCADAVEPSQTTYNGLIHAHARGSDAQGVHEWLARSVVARLHPTTVTYNILADACSRVDDAPAAERFVRGIAAARVQPSAAMYESLVARDLARAPMWLARSIAARLCPSAAMQGKAADAPGGSGAAVPGTPGARR